MNKVRYFLIFFIFVSFAIFSNFCYAFNNQYDSDNTNTNMSDNDQAFLFQDEKTGRIKSSTPTKDISFVTSISLHIPSNILNISQLQSFEIEFVRNLPTFSWGASYNRTNIILNNYVDTKSNYYLNNKASLSSSSSINSFNFYLGIRTNLMQRIFNSNDYFEMMGFSISYDILNEPSQNQTFSGFGNIFSFAIYNQISSHFYYGIKISSKISSMRTAKSSTLVLSPATTSNRSLSISIFDIAMTLSWYL